MEEKVEQAYLYDFYGELLTEHQKAIYEDVVNNDMSYSEIARMNQISRQGVYDMIKRCDKILEEYEDKLQLVDKFMKARKQVEKMKDCISELMEENRDDRLNSKIEAIDRLSDRILDEF